MNNLITLPSSDFMFLLWTLLLGIVYIKTVWIATEIKYFKKRITRITIRTTVIEFLILFLQVLVIFILPLPKTAYDGLLTIVGVLLYIVGMFFALWGRSAIKTSWQQHHLVTDGAYAFSRNPIYVGFFLISIGFCLAIESWLVFLSIPLFIFFYRSAIKEEKSLEKTFVEKYIKYKAKVPRFLFGV